jgi:octaprenyl-diphosphate synthase
MSIPNPVDDRELKQMASSNGLGLQLPAGFLAELEKFLARQTDQFEAEIRPLAKYALENSGRRLRPSLIYFSGAGEDGAYPKDLVNVAAVVELVHIATLVHDDILDEAELRRRKPTVYHKEGSAVAVLLGDALFAQALRLASEYKTTLVCREVAQATRSVCAGETRQVHLRGDLNMEVGEYLRIIELKTAELFRVSCLLGALVREERDVSGAQALASFGKHLGRAYQIFDDAVDFIGREESMGKTLGTDLATGKLTLPALLLRDKLGIREFQDIFRQLQAGDAHAGRVALSCKMEESDVFPQVEEYFGRELQAARTGLVRSSVSGYSRGMLENLLVFLEGEFTGLVRG